MMSRQDPKLLEILAADKRSLIDKIDAELMGKTYKSFVRYWHKTKPVKTTEIDDWIITSSKIAIDAGIEPDIWHTALISALKDLYGDPKTMYDSAQTKHFTVPYWNPTNHLISITPLGLKGKRLGTDTWEDLTHVLPGAIINLPEHLTLGGKSSAIHSVAPQLKPCPRKEDLELDLTPVTFEEWCTFGTGNKHSACCKRLVVWSDRASGLLCSKCGEISRGN